MAAGLLLAAACAPPPSAVDPAHPLIGTWEFRAPGADCVESSEFMTDGTSRFESAAEQAKTRYEVAAAPSPAGYYRLVDTIVESNGKPSCSGRSIPVGHKVSVYLKFLPSRREMMLCTSESEKTCVAKFIRREPKKEPPTSGGGSIE